MRKTTLFLSGALLLVTSMAFAQPSSGGGKHFVERMTSQLELSNTQSEKFKEIMSESHAKMKAIRAETRSKLKEVLTTEQQQEMKQMREKHHDKKRERCGKKG